MSKVFFRLSLAVVLKIFLYLQHLEKIILRRREETVADGFGMPAKISAVFMAAV